MPRNRPGTGIGTGYPHSGRVPGHWPMKPAGRLQTGHQTGCHFAAGSQWESRLRRHYWKHLLTGCLAKRPQSHCSGHLPTGCPDLSWGWKRWLFAHCCLMSSETGIGTAIATGMANSCAIGSYSDWKTESWSCCWNWKSMASSMSCWSYSTIPKASTGSIAREPIGKPQGQG